MPVFVCVRYLSVLLVPLTFFRHRAMADAFSADCRRGALLSPLISTHALYASIRGGYLGAGSGTVHPGVASPFGYYLDRDEATTRSARTSSLDLVCLSYSLFLAHVS